MIDLSRVNVINGPSDVFQWPATSRITEFEFRPGSIHMRHTKETEWPPVPYGDAEQQATLWFIGRINGEWYAAGMERIRPNQQDKPEGDDPMGFIAGLVEGRPFGPFNDHTFTYGEPFGVMVVAGITRLGNDTIVQERSLVVEMAYPPHGPFTWTEGQPDQGGGTGDSGGGDTGNGNGNGTPVSPDILTRLAVAIEELTKAIRDISIQITP